MSKGIVIGRRKIKPRFIFFIFTLILFIFFLVRYINKPIISHVVESGDMHLEYDSEAILVRDEEVYNAPEYGRVTYYANEEDYVHKEDLVATIFKANYQEEMVAQLYNVQEKIINYQQENILNDIADHDLKNIQSKVEALVYEIQTNVKNDTLSDLAKEEKEFRNLLLQKQQLVEKKTVPDSYLQKLNEEEANISQQLKEWKIDIMAPRSGLLSYQIDNLENILTFNSLKKLDSNSYKDLINWRVADNRDKKDDQTEVGRPFFRIIDAEKWYTVCEIKYPKVFFKENETVSISFLDFEDKVLEGKVTRIIDGNNTFLLVIESREDIEDFINTRNTSIRLSKSVNGLVVPKRAIIDKKTKKGVFKIQGNEMIFTDVDIIGESKQYDYVIIDEGTSLLEEGDVINLN